MMDWRTWTEACREVLATFGIDRVGAARLDRYQARVPQAFHLPAPRPDALVVVIGHTKALWPHFLDALRAEPGRLDRPDPLDTWMQSIIPAALGPLSFSAIRFAHHAPPNAVAIQALADQAGVARLGPAHLSCDPEAGVWVAWRAAVVVNIPGPETPQALASDPCARCPQPCVPALERALATPTPLTQAGVAESWQRWVAVRDACPVAPDARYGADQIAYHYQKNPADLRRLLAESPPPGTVPTS